MAFNKKLATWSLTLASTLLLAACGGDTAKEESSEAASEATSEVVESSSEVVATTELQDGTYKLVQKNLDENGWKVDFTMVVKDGKITESNYDYLNAEGAKKSEDEGYQEAMVGKVGVGPQDYLPQLNEQLVATQDAAAVEVVSGATHSSDVFKEYAQQLIDAAKEGNTETIEIDN